MLRWVLVPILGVFSWAAAAESAAKTEVERVRALVAAGAAPRAQLEKAEHALADAEDDALLRRMLYGQDLTEDSAEEMISAAERRLARRRQEVQTARRMVDEGVASLLSVGPYLQEKDRAQKEYDLAVSRARLLRELTAMARAEEALERQLEDAPAEAAQFAERYQGSGGFTLAQLSFIEAAFASRFIRPLPVSARGATAVHRALGFDHRDRVDVAVHPDEPEGVWLRQYLTDRGIPFYAFRAAVPGKATGAHIHIGLGSARVLRGG